MHDRNLNRLKTPIITILFAGIVVVSCVVSKDPIDKINNMYDDVIIIMRSSSVDANEKKVKIAELLQKNHSEIIGIEKQLESEFAAIKSEEEKESFIKRFDKFLERIRELQILAKENDIEF